MQWLTDLDALLGTSGAYANASRSLAEKREVAARLDCFLTRFEHPAGHARIQLEPPVSEGTRVA